MMDKPNVPEGSIRNLTPLYAQPKPAPEGWLRAIDEALVCWHIGIADADDSLEIAKEKLHKLIKIEIQAATDPAVNGGYQLVPKEPTESMLNAAYDVDAQIELPNTYLEVFKAMIAAAPKGE